MKTDSLGDTLWTRCFGVSGEEDAAYGIATTYDGGFVITGRSALFGSPYLLKTDSLGNTEWSSSFSGYVSWSVQQTSDSGYILTGCTSSSGQGNVFLTKTDSGGNLQWSRTYGGQDHDAGYAVEGTSDRGYIVVGLTQSFGNHIWIIKTDSLGDSVWTTTIGVGSGGGFSVCEVAGRPGYYVTGETGGQGIVARLDYDGNVEWTWTFGGAFSGQGNSILSTLDGGAILTGIHRLHADTFDVYVARLRSTGDTVWSARINEEAYQLAYSIERTSPTECVVAGVVDPLSGNRQDVLLVKVRDRCPIVDRIAFDSDMSYYNLTNHNPVISWHFLDIDLYPQDSFEIDVGTDTNWTVSETWDPSPFAVSDTSVVYSGLPLLDGETYYLRLRVRNGFFWSEWYETSFRMNSIPSVPAPLNPIDDVIVGTTPTLWAENSADAEGDALIYDFLVDVDTLYGEPDPVLGYGIPEGEDSTGWQVTETLDENKRYVWIVRAFDSYEYSDWTGGYEYTFFVNGTPEPPTAPQAQFPPDTGGTPVWDMLTYFYWAPSTDPDPLDTVRYKLEIAVDSTFIFVNTIDSIESVPFTLDDSLSFGTRYWWRVTAFDKTGLSTLSPNTPDFWTWTLGDVDHSHDVSVGDLTYLVAFLFQGGQAIYPLFIGDVDGSCTVDVGDLTYLVAYLFQSGPAPKVGCVPGRSDSNI
ncbi:MAG: hypothetical protein ABII79_00790 [bacterium]